MKVSEAAKAVVATIAGIAVNVANLVEANTADGVWDANDWVVLALTILTVIGVYQVPNAKPVEG